MGKVSQQQLQGVYSRGKFNFCLGLTHAEMPVLIIGRDRLVQGRQLRIDEQVMMAGVFISYASRRYTHSLQAEAYGHRITHFIAIGR